MGRIVRPESTRRACRQKANLELSNAAREGEIMTNYFGKQKLTLLLFSYLELSSPIKLAELKRELKESGTYRKHIIRYKKSRGDEWLTTSIFFGKITYDFEIYSFGGAGKYVTLREQRRINDRRGNEIKAEIFSGYAYYDKDFKPITETTDKYSDFLICNRLQKTDKPSSEHKEGEHVE